MQDLIGRTLGHYRIVEKIGAGGMGEVYRAHDERLDREVAIKVLHQDVAQDVDRLARFEREAKAVAKLAHPNILEIWDFGTDEGVTYAVTELLEGENLSQRIPSNGMGWQKAAEIGASVADGLAVAHGKGIVHRDLKPENVFVTADGRVKILDFGLAQVKVPVDKEAETETLTPAGTVPGTVMGTVGYMSPEQVRGNPADARSDIFSLGCVLYEMLTGKIAFARESTADTQAAILKEEPPALTAVDVAVPAELDRTARRCLEKNPEARFQSASDLAFALRSIASDTDAVRPGPAPVAPRRRRGRLWAAAAAAVVVGTAAVVLNVVGLRSRPVGTASRAPIRSLAVLPLENLSGDAEQEYFVDGMTEALIADLAQIEALKVISRTSAMRYKNTDKPLPQIARELNVDGIVEGSVLRAGERVRITAQLIHASTDRHVWAKSYERDLEDILSLQKEVARAVSTEIRVRVTEPEHDRLLEAGRLNPEAYENYLRGRWFWNHRAVQQSHRVGRRLRSGVCGSCGFLRDPLVLQSDGSRRGHAQGKGRCAEGGRAG
jgi:TolB-like protein